MSKSLIKKILPNYLLWVNNKFKGQYPTTFCPTEGQSGIVLHPRSLAMQYRQGLDSIGMNVLGLKMYMMGIRWNNLFWCGGSRTVGSVIKRGDVWVSWTTCQLSGSRVETASTLSLWTLLLLDYSICNRKISPYKVLLLLHTCLFLLLSAWCFVY